MQTGRDAISLDLSRSKRKRDMHNLYDRIGNGYASRRRPDSRIFTRIHSCLDGISSVLNVGAGAGSYEPLDRSVVAIEPSRQMILQRRNRANVLQAKAEALPLEGRSFDAVMALLTIHHWKDKTKGLEECRRVARKRVLILTWDPASEGFWLVQEYFPELLAYDREIFPSIEEIEKSLGQLLIERLAIPADCVDGLLGAYWRRPSAYLEEAVRSGMSSFSRMVGMQARLEALRRDIVSGDWERRHRCLVAARELDIGYRLISADLS